MKNLWKKLTVIEAIRFELIVPKMNVSSKNARSTGEKEIGNSI